MDERLKSFLETMIFCEGTSGIDNNDINTLLENKVNLDELRLYIRKIKKIIGCTNGDSKIIHDLCNILRNSDNKSVIWEYERFIEKLFEIQDFNGIEDLGRHKENVLLECGNGFDALKVWSLHGKVKQFKINGKKMSIKCDSDYTLIINGGWSHYRGIFLPKEGRAIYVEDEIELIARLIEINHYNYAIISGKPNIDEIDEHLDNLRLNNKDYIWVLGLVDVPTEKDICKKLRRYTKVDIQNLLPCFDNLYRLDVDDKLRNVWKICSSIEKGKG